MLINQSISVWPLPDYVTPPFIARAAAEQREVWGEGGEVYQIVGELAEAALARVAAEDQGAPDERTAILDRLVAREMELLESLLDGR